MGIKKQLLMSMATGALGFSMIGGGTYAYFNDTATINNSFASGTLDLKVVANSKSQPINFDLSNMKPGDSVQRIFSLTNGGSLAIKEVLLTTTASDFVDGTLLSTAEEFLSQFEVNFMQVDTESDRWEPRGNVKVDGATLTLADLVGNNLGGKVQSKYLTNGKINLAPLTVAPGGVANRGLPVDPTVDTDDVFIEIKFKQDSTINPLKPGEYLQNKFQGDSIKFAFNLEATQWDGMKLDSPNGNGKINNGVQGSADGSSQPDKLTVPYSDPGKYVTPVVD